MKTTNMRAHELPISLDDAIVALGIKENYVDLKTFLDFIMSCLKNVNGFYEWFEKQNKNKEHSVAVRIKGGFYIDLTQIRELYSDMKCIEYITKNRSDGFPFPNTDSESEWELSSD